jgi:hypothetical protein
MSNEVQTKLVEGGNTSNNSNTYNRVPYQTNEALSSAMVEGVAAGYVEVVRAYYGRVGGFIATDGSTAAAAPGPDCDRSPTVQDSSTPFCGLQGREVRPPLPCPTIMTP